MVEAGARPSSGLPIKPAPEVIAVPLPSATETDNQPVEVIEEQTPADHVATPDADNALSASAKEAATVDGEGGDKSERFVNTRHNIALINDPKNGPSFTLTNKESGLLDQPGAKEAEPAELQDEKEADEARDTASNKSTPPAPEPPKPPPKTETAMASQPAMAEKPSPMSPSPLGVPPAAEPPEKMPIDSAKTFIGPNGTYYDESWRWMDWRGTKRSWNWPAALSFGHWFAYRRLHGHASLYLAWSLSLSTALVNGIPALLLLSLLLLTPLLIGTYANILYFQMFRRAVTRITEKDKGSYVERLAMLAKAGGVSQKAPWIMAALMIMGIGFTIAATYQERGGLQVNLWPL